MIRANLLPRRRKTLSVLACEIDLDLIREIGVGIAIVIVVALISIEVERLRIDRLAAGALAREARVAANVPERETSHRLMLDLARYQEFEREAGEYRRSGANAAVSVAEIGNSLPADVWVDEIARTDNGYAIAGGSRSVDALAAAIAALGRVHAGERATLVNSTIGENVATLVHFHARLMPPAPIATPAIALRTPGSAR